MSAISVTASPLDAVNRVLLEATLRPVQGRRFQPTGFPDLGPATFQLADDTEMLLVESTQSMANRLEDVGWERPAQRPVAALDGLPYVRVVDADGAFLTSSRLEAHRLASAYVRDAQLHGDSMEKAMLRRLGLRGGVPLDHRALARAVFALDPLSLLHGVFFAIKSWPMQPKVARTVSSFIEAEDVRPAENGGVKRDDVQHTVTTGRRAEQGYGWVPFHRREFTARAIRAYFNVDLVQLRSFGLGDDAERLLLTLALWEIRSVLDRALRLRTACDLEVSGDVKVTRPEGFALPSRSDLE
ncbi:MAG TPA: type I-U CRISPR-associated RAMP protein Csb1/Cas7u, partial [Candidatus Dormibacteraeota bacterium]|nr:type I-U CRISPR-associated RAMP protein Csb1/Cas7u [Candidatus Dormibacteraeota bacterium]